MTWEFYVSFMEMPSKSKLKVEKKAINRTRKVEHYNEIVKDKPLKQMQFMQFIQEKRASLISFNYL